MLIPDFSTNEERRNLIGLLDSWFEVRYTGFNVTQIQLRVSAMKKLTREDVLQIVKAAREKGERADLSEVDLSGVDLSEVDLRNANLWRANFSRANLKRVDFRGANLGKANCGRANLSEADLRGANLEGTNFEGAYLTGAIFDVAEKDSEAGGTYTRRRVEESSTRSGGDDVAAEGKGHDYEDERTGRSRESKEEAEEERTKSVEFEDRDFALPVPPAPSAPVERSEPPALRSAISPATDTDRVEFGVFAPRRILPKTSFILDVWAYLPADYQDVLNRTKEVERDVSAGRKTGVPVARGSFLTVTVEIPSLKIADPTDTIFWEGEPASASFIVEVPEETGTGSFPGQAVISVDGLRLAKVVFVISVAAAEDQEYVDQSSACEMVRTAFASYASKDRDDVLSRIQGMRKIDPDLDIFLDVLSLRSGDDWAAKLNEHVPSKDVFYLFWSKHASQSEWVEKEWRLALAKRGIGYIDPVPMVNPQDAPPPKELQSLHFNDRYLVHIENIRLRQQLAQGD